MLYPLFFAFKEMKNRLLAGLLYLSALASGVIMGFSPTVFASGSRPFFLANILMILLCILLIKEGIGYKESKLSDFFLGKTIIAKLAITSISLIALYSFFMYLFEFASIYYWWY
jgi:hypothetical protein